MGIFRVKKDNNYSVINNTGLKDKTLSWKAKGVLAYALTLPDDWTFHISELAQHAKDGEDSLRTGINELKKAGYVKRYPVRDEQTQKITSWETEIYEIPHREKPLVENPTLLSTKELSTNLTNDDVDKHPLINEEFQKSYNYLLQNNIPLSETAMQDLGEFSDVLGSQIIMEAVDRAVD